ncbi:MAG: NfeD family protein [Saprospiraceae bacterium]|nr:NfeD family protein [Saprospiraceae bacterium]MCB9310537.1 NfeD family protein [Lewinellaceae bacterium]
MDFLHNADIYLKGFWYLAIPVSILFLIINGLPLLDLDSIDTDVEHPDSPSDLLSFRNILNFLLGLSWGGIAFYSTVQNKALLIIVAIVIGLIFFYTFKYFIQQFLKLQEDNTFDIARTIGQLGEAYLRIPPDGTGTGKVHILMDGRLHELDAMTEGKEISTGEKIEVIGLNDKNILIVKPKY